MATSTAPRLPEPLRLRPAALAVRLVPALVVLVGLFWGAVRGADINWPFGLMVQYALWEPPDQTVHDLYMEADTAAGTHVAVPLTVRVVGVNRAQVEYRQGTFEAHPDQLAELTAGCAARNPGKPRLTRVYLRSHETVIRDDRIVRRYDTDVVVWGPGR